MTDYTEQWPKLAPQWCDDEIDKARAELKSGVATDRAKDLEQRIQILRRVKADYGRMFGA